MPVGEDLDAHDDSTLSVAGLFRPAIGQHPCQLTVEDASRIIEHLGEMHNGDQLTLDDLEFIGEYALHNTKDSASI